MTTIEAIDRLRKCGVEGLPIPICGGTRWDLLGGGSIDAAHEVVVHNIAFACGMFWLDDKGFKPQWRDGTLEISMPIGDGAWRILKFQSCWRLRNVAEAVEATNGAGGG